MEGLVGTVLDNTYRVEKLLGQGGMGAVYRAHDVALNRPVAIKVMHAHVAQQPGFRERFMQEARAIAALEHPGIVQIYTFSRDPQLLYLVMAFIPGQNLEDWLHLLKERGMVLSLPESLALVARIADALAYAHTRGVYHRDIKPGNIILRPLDSGQADPDSLGLNPMLTDFGLAKLAEGGIMSVTGTSMGTPSYMAPEQCEGVEVDGRADIYALGIVLYEMVTGRLPFRVNTLTEAIRAHTKEPPPPPRSVDPGIPSQVEEIILRALAKAPADRYQTATELAAALRAARAGLVVPENATMAAPAPKASLATMISTESPAPTPEAERWPTPPAGGAGGQIVILQEDGNTRALPLGSKKRITIGRDADNDIALDDAQISRHHAQVTIDASRVQITDLNSTNGTWIGDNRLLPGVAEVWRSAQSVRVGNHWLKLQGIGGAAVPVAEAVVPAAGTYAPRVPTPAGDPIQASLDPATVTVRTGVPAVVTLRLLNRQQQVDHLAPTVEGIPAEWVSLPQEMLRLAPGDAGTMTIRILAPRSHQSAAGEHPYAVRVHSQSQPAQSVAAAGVVTVEPFRELSLALTPRVISNAGRGRVSITNGGNATETIVLTVQDADQVLKPSQPSSAIAVPAGQIKDVSLPLAMAGKRPLMGSAETHAFGIAAEIGEETVATTTATLQVKPLFPTWAIPLLTTLAVLICAASALAYTSYQKDRAATATAEALAIVNATQTADTRTEREQTQVAQATATQEAVVLAAAAAANAATVSAESTAAAQGAATQSAQVAATQQAAIAAIQATAAAAGTAAAIANQPSPTPYPTATDTPTATATPTPAFGPSEARGFTISGTTVGTYSEVCLQHDNTGPSPDWFVDRVLVAGDSGYIPFVFNRWIASDKADGSLVVCTVLPTPTPTRTSVPTATTVPTPGPSPTFSITGIIGFLPRDLVFRPIAPVGPLPPAMRTYDLLVVTGTEPDAGTGAQVRIRLVGASGATDWITLSE